MNSVNYALTYSYVHGKSAMKNLAQNTKKRVEEFKNDESGMEIIAVVLILIIVIALAVVFRKAIGNLFVQLWASVSKALKGETDTVNAGTASKIGDAF
ncbi:MAG: hypothetical protein K6B74_09860 [Ruminococcus sp.]|nr:hypothetical protein [Ruminococcus sp.]